MSGDSSSALKACTDTVITEGSRAESRRFRGNAHRHGRLRREKIISSSFKEPAGKSDDSHTQRVANTNRVEDFWKCKLADSLPTALKPRLRIANGKRVGPKQQDTRRLPAKQWTKAFLRALEDLAFVTRDDQASAHEKLIAEVKKRQNKGTHAEYYAREVLTSDLQSVAREFKRLRACGHYPPKSLRRGGGGMRIPQDNREASDITEPTNNEEHVAHSNGGRGSSSQGGIEEGTEAADSSGGGVSVRQVESEDREAKGVCEEGESSSPSNGMTIMASG
ncbi:hypothetical protein LTR97_008415 [Elasticomyces elasticus]|uniref:Uncharacterized protein n=1 Tax=Elasticomyces elasticus TaxID=574655 RepID=A0AAN7W3R0_9PEZI|nr:hypothetical protein LTR97_008415 [Elasticomyces elasticus]